MENCKRLILVFVVFPFSFLLAQDTWIQSYQPFGLGYYVVEDVLVCSDGGYAINGWYEDEWELEQWAFIMKADSEGNLEWATKDTANGTFYAESHAMVETDDGGFLVASRTLAGPATLTKFNSSGDIIWNEPVYDCWVRSMDKTNDGNIILAGYSMQLYKPEIKKITQEGVELWSNTFTIEGYNDFGRFNSVISSSDGGYILTGYLLSDLTQYDILVMKTDVNGDSLWARTYDAYGGGDFGQSITEDNEGEIMCTGKISHSGTRGFLWLLDENGETYWIEEVDTAIGYGHYSITSSGTEFIAITYDLDDNTIIYYFDNSYNILWDNAYPGHTGNGDKSVHILDDGIIFSNYTGYGGSDNNYINLIKTDSIGNVVSVNDEIIISTDYKLSNYPNPFNPTTTIKFELPINIRKSILEIFNVKGQIIDSFALNENQNSLQWNAEDYSSGIYLYHIRSDNQIFATNKMVLLK